MVSITSIEFKCNKYAAANNMQLNGYTFGQMFTVIEDTIDKIWKYDMLDYTQYHFILDEATAEFKNPENWAMREEITEDLKLLGYSFVSNGIFKIK